MARLTCPHCARPVAAHPTGRWYRTFLCPHCRQKLRFTPLTNTLGLASSALFFAMVWALVMGRGETARWVVLGSGLAWLLLLGASHVLRGIEKA
ncbi:MAG TPA: hypothetical protein VM073_06470 [Usitatibacter sp.]|nr:hypothetical protein [Usitatibacter sp.]